MSTVKFLKGFKWRCCLLGRFSHFLFSLVMFVQNAPKASVPLTVVQLVPVSVFRRLVAAVVMPPAVFVVV